MRQTTQQINSILTKEQLQNDYDELKSITKICEKYKISEGAVRRRIKELDIVYNKKSKYNKNENIFETINSTSLYLAGFIAADGCIYHHKNKYGIDERLVICLSDKDYNFLELIRNKMECDNPIGIYKVKYNNKKENWSDNLKVCKLSLSSKKIVKDLEKFNIGSKKSLTYDMPDWLINHPDVNHFLRGYSDGDGCFYISKEKLIAFSLRGTLPFLNNVKKIFNNYNIESDALPKMSNGIGQFSIHSNKLVAKIFDFLYGNADFYMERKFNIAYKAKKIIDIQEKAKNDIDKILKEI